MRMREFVEKYCGDLQALYSETANLLEEDYDLPFDAEIEDDSGQKVKVVYAGNTAIPVMDIISTDRSDFIRMYPSFECRELYDQYIDGLIIVEGEEAINRIRNMIRREQDRVDAFKQQNSFADALC